MEDRSTPEGGSDGVRDIIRCYWSCRLAQEAGEESAMQQEVGGGAYQQGRADVQQCKKMQVGIGATDNPYKI